MSTYSLTYKPFGESAILITWPAEMNEEILKETIRFYQKIRQKRKPEIIEIIQSLNSLTVIYNPNLVTFPYLKKALEKIYSEKYSSFQEEYYLWKIPVCYDLKFGLDLPEISSKTKLPFDEIIRMHTDTVYRVYSIGFLPGFLYLGGLDSRLFIDRKATPRLEVPKGAVAIGGKQTGIYPKSSPGGWQIIGKTPISFFDSKKKNPCFSKPGDKIQFYQISVDEFDEIQRLVYQNVFLIKKEVIDD